MNTSRPSLHRRVRQAFLVAVVVAVAAAALGALAFRDLLDSRSRLVDRVDRATVAAERLLGALVDQETAVRDFVLTSDPTFLGAYTTGRAEQVEQSAELQRLVGGIGGVAAVLDDVERAAERWRADVADPVVAGVATGVTPTGTPGSEEGQAGARAQFDDVRAAVERVRTELALERDDARAALREATAQLVTVLVFTAAVMLLIVGGLYVLIRRHVEQPLVLLLDDARAVTAGSFHRPVVPRGLAELHELGAAVDAMRLRVVEDLAQAEAANDALERQARELARSNAELEQFAYVASHDLQEPLRKVTAFCQLLQDRYGGQLDERADQYIDFAVDGAKRMQVLINDLLTFSRVGRTDAPSEIVDAELLVDQAIANLGAVIEPAGAVITRDPLPVVRIPTALGVAVFQNLIGNAVKFRRPDRPPVIHLGARIVGDQHELHVADNGIGIEPAYADRVFVIFQRLHTKEEYPGTGIGLALCRKIVERYDGRIWLDPDVTEGTVVRFTLPIPADEPLASP